MPKFSIYINESEKAKLEQIAKREGKTRNAVIREAVQEAIQNWIKENKK